MLERAVAARVSCRWVAADSVHAGDYALRLWVERQPTCTAWRRHLTLAMLALAFLAVVRAAAIGGKADHRPRRRPPAPHRAGDPDPPGPLGRSDYKTGERPPGGARHPERADAKAAKPSRRSGAATGWARTDTKRGVRPRRFPHPSATARRGVVGLWWDAAGMVVVPPSGEANAATHRCGTGGVGVPRSRAARFS